MGRGFGAHALNASLYLKLNDALWHSNQLGKEALSTNNTKPKHPNQHQAQHIPGNAPGASRSLPLRSPKPLYMCPKIPHSNPPISNFQGLAMHLDVGMNANPQVVVAERKSHNPTPNPKPPNPKPQTPKPPNPKALKPKP